MASDFASEFSRLNSDQKKAVSAIDGPIAVIAGPGTGKTQLLSLRVANILKLTDTSPSNILCLTFTEAAADNIRERLRSFIGSESNFVEIHTFHGFGSNIIQTYPEYFNDSPLLKNLNELGQFEIVQSLLSRLHHDNPLSKRMGSAFLHLPTLISSISWFKQAGLTPDDLRIESLKNREFFNNTHKFLDIAFANSPSSKQIDVYVTLLKNLSLLEKKYPSNIAKQSITELEEAIAEIDEKSRYAKSITSWRNNWLIQARPARWQYIDQQKNNLLIHVADFYEKYEETLRNNGLYTYDDMIIRTLSAMQSSEELKLLLQEKYQYILVDEFQDTNGAQYNLLTVLGDNVINEGRPNIMVVGDDDQAIYRFQGAQSSIISEFINQWQETEVIVLKESYRSGQELLDMSRKVILNAKDRLENQDSKYTKILKSGLSKNSTKIIGLDTPTQTENYINTARTIEDLIKKGANPSSIAVISPKHKYIKELEPYLLELEIPISYEQSEHILYQPRIIEIVDLISLVWAASNAKTLLLESLLPKILAAPYFQLSTNSWWEIALLAQKDHQGWLSAAQSYGSPVLKDFLQAIKYLGKEAKSQQFKLTLSYLLGNKSVNIDDKKFSLPWREHYFSDEMISKEPYEHLRFIGQFNTLLDYFEQWDVGQKKLLTIDDFYRFIEIYRSSNLSLLDKTPFLTAKDAVTLTTAHKAKGLEWDNVFVLDCHDDVWGSKARTRNLTFKLPSSLVWIEPARLSSNDLVRLFYVSITRAKRNLFLTSYELKDNGSPTSPIGWLNDAETDFVSEKQYKSVEPIQIIHAFNTYWQDLYNTPTEDLATILKPTLAAYKLSATHLNNFLSVERGGPKYFLIRSLLKVPDLLSTNTFYGQAIHKTLEFTHHEFSEKKELPDLKQINDYFVEDLKSYPLTTDEYKFLKKRGIDNLAMWLDTNREMLSIEDISEYNFARENIALRKARLTGKIDVLRKNDRNHLVVIDYKTSQPLYSWKGNSGPNAIRSYTYQKQLMFYKLLVDNSATFKNKFETDAGQINFISPDNNNEIITLGYEFDEAALERYKKLIEIVWAKIMNLDLPDTSHYPATLTGIRNFEEDLLNGKI